MSRVRTAIYFTPPPDHGLTLTAARWLDRNVYGDPVSDGPGLTVWRLRNGSI
ncbi:hypothetical protein [Breoghania sp.]|uniref:hypothetical protein n=1 Tax=Breoghania sp. TaxID=2065378 RepID=UPI002621C62D|nr:hypothetical protein [Breoghania sp.]MDJ0930033.1 hypothetical protein [Breoghania sp.]